MVFLQVRSVGQEAVYQQLIGSAEKRKLKEESIEKYEEKFQVFLGITLFLLVMEAVISERK